MTTPDIPKPEGRLISGDTFTQLRDAMRNLFDFGPLAGLEEPQFSAISIKDGVEIVLEPQTSNWVPSHTYSGMIYPYSGTGMFRSFEVWKRFEGSPPSIALLDGSPVDIGTVLREGVTHIEDDPLDQTGYVLTMDDRAFDLPSTLNPLPDHLRAEIPLEMHEDDAVLTVEILNGVLRRMSRS